MARAPLLQLSQVSLTFGGNPLFDSLDLTIQPGDRIALVGRNGSGKSTLLKLMAGLSEADRGDRVVPPGMRVGYMEQDPDLSAFATLGDYAGAGLPPGEDYKVIAAAEGLDFRPDAPVATASGGETIAPSTNPAAFIAAMPTSPEPEARSSTRLAATVSG